ncbi:DUF3352 domain-containing protein [Leptolyngbya sp. FACHB-541]|uniref:DUF3352 domain-containing protein n=1 Tax=Leptolyngbya sp. FACHB-541 TaxID=2692810 RepID=UPI00168A313A|nr:DUF3352 domain-containing protein [Leptolyngbya sp. FACHB-541]
MTKKRKSTLLLLSGAAIALVAGGIGAYWLLARRLPAGGLPVGMDVLPQTALMTLSFSTDESQWRTLRQFGTDETQTSLNQTLADLRDRLLTANGYDYKRDIQPWVGDEITVAFLSAQSPVAEGEESEESEESEPPILQPQEDPQTAVMILPIEDPARAQQILTEPKSEQGATLSERDYQGVQIREFESAGETYSAAVLDNRLLVITTAGDAIEQVIDTSKGGASVAQTPGFNQALRQIVAPQPFARIYVNAPAARAIASAGSPQALPPQNLTPLQNNRGIAATVTLESEGLRFQGVAWLDPDSETVYEVKNGDDKLPDLLPAETLLMASGGNLQRFWQDYSQRAEMNPISPLSPENLRTGLNNLTGLDLEEDLISWMGGEFSLSVIEIPSSAEPPAEPGTVGTRAGVLIMVKASDRAAADATLAELDELVGDRYRFQVQETDIEGQPVVQWTSPLSGLTITRGWLEGDVAFLAFGANLAQTILPQPDASLVASQPFEQSVDLEFDPNNGHFFVNVDRLLSEDSPVPVPNLPPANEAFIQAIRAIGVTAAIQDRHSTRYDVRVLLDKTDRPSELPAPSVPPASPSPESP